MTRRCLEAVAVLALGVACSGSDVAAPDGASDDARFFAFDPSALPACGEVDRAPARGRLPALGPLLAREGAILLELDPAPIAALYPDGDDVPIFRIATPGEDLAPLPAPRRAWTVSGGRFTSIAPPEIPELVLMREPTCVAAIERRCASTRTQCAELEMTANVLVPRAIDDGLGFVLALDEDVAFVSAEPRFNGEPQRFYVVDAASPAPRDLETLAEDSSYLAAYRRAEHEIYLFGPYGTLMRGDVESGFSRLVDANGYLSKAAWMDGPHDGSPLELFTLDSFGVFQRFDGATRTFTELSPNQGQGERLFGGVAWIGRGEAIAAGARESHVFHFKDGVLSIERFTTDDVRASAIAVVPSLGVVLGTDHGLLYVNDGSGWSELPSPMDGQQIRGIVPYGDGFVFGHTQSSNNGSIVQYVPGLGLCNSIPITDPEVHALVPSPGGFVVYSKALLADAFVGFVHERGACDVPAN